MFSSLFHCLVVAELLDCCDRTLVEEGNPVTVEIFSVIGEHGS